MANAFKNTTLVTRYAVIDFENALQMAGRVDRQAEKEFRKVGQTIKVRRPVRFETESGATISSSTDIEEGTIDVTLDQRHHVSFTVDSDDMTLEVDDFRERYVRPAMEELAQNVENELADSYKRIYNFVGTPGTTPASFLAVANAKKLLDETGVPTSLPKDAFYDPEAIVNLADALKGVFPDSISRRAIENAMIKRIGDFTIYQNNSLKNHTVGVATGTPLVNGASQNVTYAASKDTWTQSLVTDGWTNSTTGILLEGDVFTIAGVNSINQRTRADTGNLQTFVVTADADSGASTGPATLTISPPIITSGPYQTVTAAPADNAAITVKTGTGGTTHRQNLAFAKNAITLATAPLDMPPGSVEASQATHKGVSIRTVVFYNGTTDVSTWRFDILYGVKVQNPGFAVRTTG